jgi:hypothetical protein
MLVAFAVLVLKLIGAVTGIFDYIFRDTEREACLKRPQLINVYSYTQQTLENKVPINTI